MTITDDALIVELGDGRSISAPLAWFPRLLHASPVEGGRWSLTGRGKVIQWEDVDEDISVEGLLAGRPSAESQILCGAGWRAGRGREGDDNLPRMSSTAARPAFAAQWTRFE